jgi:hypothetical protein
MKRISFIALFFVAVGFFATALADPPENSGVVSRGVYQGAWVDIDTDSGLLSVLGVDIFQWCTDGAPFEFISYSDKQVQNELRIVTLEKAELTASVWPFTVFDCDLFTTVPPLATGLASYQLHDNDLFGPVFCEEKNNANAFGRKAKGTLYTAGGEMVQFKLHSWGIYDCETDTFPLFKTRISLRD